MACLSLFLAVRISRLESRVERVCGWCLGWLPPSFSNEQSSEIGAPCWSIRSNKQCAMERESCVSTRQGERMSIQVRDGEENCCRWSAVQCSAVLCFVLRPGPGLVQYGIQLSTET